MDLKIKKLEKENIEDFVEIGRFSYRDNIKGENKLKLDLKENFAKDDIKNGYFYTLIKDNETIGVCTIVKRNRDLMNGADVFNIAIKKDLKGKGYGKTFMNLIFEEVKNLGFNYTFISTSENISGFYKKCGMKEYGRIKRNKSDRIYLVKEL